MSATSNTTGNSAARAHFGVTEGASIGIKNIWGYIKYLFGDDAVTTRQGVIRLFVGTADPTSEYLIYTDAVAPLGSIFILIGATTATLLVKTVANNGSSISGFKSVTVS